jgi:hypothetical protein
VFKFYVVGLVIWFCFERVCVIVGLSEKGETRCVWWWLCVLVVCCWSSYVVLF